MLTISPAGVAELKIDEGLRLVAYRDPGGYFTMGYGHKILPGETFSSSFNITDANNLLAKDLQPAIAAVNSAITTGVTQTQVDSLISLAFNIGANAFKTSELVKMINRRDPPADIYKRWIEHYITSNGISSPGLLARRIREATNFIHNYTNELPSTTTPEIITGRAVVTGRSVINPPLHYTGLDKKKILLISLGVLALFALATMGNKKTGLAEPGL